MFFCHVTAHILTDVLLFSRVGSSWVHKVADFSHIWLLIKLSTRKETLISITVAECNSVIRASERVGWHEKK